MSSNIVKIWGVALARPVFDLYFTIERSSTNRYATDEQLMALTGLDRAAFIAAWEELIALGMLIVGTAVVKSELTGTASKVRYLQTAQPRRD